jgi:hypothetical protein
MWEGFGPFFERNRKVGLAIIFGPTIITAIAGILIAYITSSHGDKEGPITEDQIRKILTASIDGSHVSTRLKSLTCLVCRNVKSVKNDQMCYDAACIGQFGASIEGKKVTVTVVADAPYTPKTIRAADDKPQPAKEKPDDIPILIESQQGKTEVVLEAAALADGGSWSEAASFRIIDVSDELTKVHVPMERFLRLFSEDQVKDTATVKPVSYMDVFGKSMKREKVEESYQRLPHSEEKNQDGRDW